MKNILAVSLIVVSALPMVAQAAPESVCIALGNFAQAIAAGRPHGITAEAVLEEVKKPNANNQTLSTKALNAFDAVTKYVYRTKVGPDAALVIIRDKCRTGEYD